MQKFNMTFVSLRNTSLDVYILLDLSSSLVGVSNLLQRDLKVIGKLIVCTQTSPSWEWPHNLANVESFSYFNEFVLILLP